MKHRAIIDIIYQNDVISCVEFMKRSKGNMWNGLMPL